tara:strand:- start:49 stop:1254 length:1206 start_codon:yes stop_codon:yes gene_type:complete
MKVRPIILCGGAGTRLWSNTNKHQAKQFIDFGNWTLLDKTLQRIKSSLFDYPIISTNKIYLKQVKQHLKKNKIKNFNIILEPMKKNTAPAILTAALIKHIPSIQPLLFLSSDHLIENIGLFNKNINKNKRYLTEDNIFIFGIKPTSPLSEFGYFLTKKNKKTIDRVSRFIEKPNQITAKKIINNNGYWNSGIFFARKDSIIKNFKILQSSIYKNCLDSINKSKIKKNIYFLNKASFSKISSKSFDKAILEKTKKINSIKLNINWSDLGSWKEILKMYDRNKHKYYKKKNIFHRPWGSYTNLFKGKNFLIKELYVKPKGILSLQKHNYRSEHWLITKGNPIITLNTKKISKRPNEHIYIPKKAKHRIQNLGKKPVKILEAQIGSLLKESDIIRYADIYGRVK